MSRYIDADALIMALRLEYPMIPMFKESRKEWEEKTEGYRKAEEIINDAPTIDAVSVVRCKECRWQSVVSDDEEGTSYYMCGVWANATDEDVFCSYGEREGE